jgi:hypothetical protein
MCVNDIQFARCRNAEDLKLTRSIRISLLPQMDRRVDITDVEVPQQVQFSYSVEWYKEPNLLWKDRMNRYTESRFVPSSFKIHCLSIFISCALILVVASVLTKQLRERKQEQSQYIEIGEFDTEPSDAEEVRLFGTTNVHHEKNIQV